MHPTKFTLERNGKILGNYTFDELLAMWKDGNLCPVDRVSKGNQSQWTEVASIIIYFEKADRCGSKLEARSNVWIGGICLLIALWIFMWANDNEYFIKRYATVVDLPVFQLALLVAGIFGIVGVVKIVRGLQTRL